jgi:parallel beta-helix repeat protein
MRQRVRSHLTHANVAAMLVGLAVLLTAAVVALVAFGGGAAIAAKPLSCGDTITTDVTLHHNLVNCPNNGIIIGADDVTLNLNGHTLSGDGEEFKPCPENEPCDVGVLNDGHDGVTIKNGAITAFGPGVFLFKARHNRLGDVAANENTFNGILLVRSAHNRIARSSASRDGRTTDFPGLAMFDSHNNWITHNTLSRNGDLPLILYGSDRNQIAHNKARGNPEAGMIIEGDRNEIVRNRLVRNGGGVLISRVTRGGTAIGNVVRRNYVRGARSTGISVAPRVPKRTTLRRNRVVGAGRDGIIIGGPTTKLIANRTVRNDDDGIDVRSRTAKLTRNRAVRNGDLGIDAVRGVIDGGGNIARHNGDPRQCINIVCR